MLCFGIGEHRSLHRLPLSEPLRTLWLSFIVYGNVPEKKTVKSPVRVGINSNALCVNVSSRQSKYHAFVFQIALLKSFLALCKANDAQANIVSVDFH